MRIPPTSQKNLKISYFTILEIAVALMILAILATSFFAAVHNMNKITKRTIIESRAILILDNTLERLMQLPDRDPKKIKLIFNDEFSKSSIVNKKSITKICGIRKNTLNISIQKNSKTIAEVNINL